MNVAIERVEGVEVLDSRGRPTVSCRVTLRDGREAWASVPSGASTGTHEARELRDGDAARYHGLGVTRAVENVRTLSVAIRGWEVTDQAAIDSELIKIDGTPDKSRLGANAILAVSIAVARAGAEVSGVPLYRHLVMGDPSLPVPMVNLLSGGAHASRMLDIQDVLGVPLRARSFAEAIEIVVEVRDSIERLLVSRGHSTLKADEGGFAPPLASNEAAIELVEEASGALGLKPGVDFGIALDVAATQLWNGSHYDLPLDGLRLDSEGMIDLIGGWVDRHPIVSVEDPLGEDDWLGWSRFTARLGGMTQVVGDDLLVTNVTRLERAVRESSANSALVKMNQIGTLSETLAFSTEARDAGWTSVVSARSGETEDTALADLAIACGPAQLKVGSVSQSDRLAKYNRLIQIEKMDGLPYSGRSALGGAA